MSVTRHHSPESASTPISEGGWKYNPDDPGDRADFANFDAAELNELAREQGYDFSQHPAIDPSADYGTLTDYVTGAAIRPATAAEHARTAAAIASGTAEGATGTFQSDDPELGTVFVAGGPES